MGPGRNRSCDPWIYSRLHYQLHYAAHDNMGEYFQDLSWIQDFEADLPQNAELGRL